MDRDTTDQDVDGSVSPNSEIEHPSYDSENARRSRDTPVHYTISNGRSGVMYVTTSENAAQQIALLQAESERLKLEIERKDSTIFSLRFRSYLEALGDAHKHAMGMRAGSTGSLKAFFDNALQKALTDPHHPMHDIQNRYRQAGEPTGGISLQVKQKAEDLFSHFSRNIHKYFESGDDFRLPRNLEMHDALLADLLVALKPSSHRDGYGRIDGSVERTRFV